MGHSLPKELPEHLQGCAHINTQVHNYLGTIELLENPENNQRFFKKRLSRKRRTDLVFMETLISTRHPSLLSLQDIRKISESDYDVYFEAFHCTLREEIIQRAARQDSYSNTEIYEIMNQVCSALQHYQQKYIAHRKITTDAIFKTSAGQYKTIHPYLLGLEATNAGEVMLDNRSDAVRFLPLNLASKAMQSIAVRTDMYKDDVFALGISILDACDLREGTRLPEQRLRHLSNRYSAAVISILEVMLKVDEEQRSDSLVLAGLLRDPLLRSRIDDTTTCQLHEVILLALESTYVHVWQKSWGIKDKEGIAFNSKKPRTKSEELLANRRNNAPIRHVIYYISPQYHRSC